MFTGIVEEVGTIVEATHHRLVVGATTAIDGVAIGDSIAVNGACLTVVELTNATLAFDLSDETLERTALSSLVAGSPVDLERALLPTSRMGGHFVQGHVDGVGKVVELSGSPEARVMSIEAPPEVERYIVEKGFITVDGISLTVTGLIGLTFSIAVIPYTWEHTVLGSKQLGDGVNLEVDVLAKYVAKFLHPTLPQR